MSGLWVGNVLRGQVENKMSFYHLMGGKTSNVKLVGVWLVLKRTRCLWLVFCYPWAIDPLEKWVMSLRGILPDLPKITRLSQPAFSCGGEKHVIKYCDKTQHKRFPLNEETKLSNNWGGKNNAQFPHRKAITIKWGIQFLDEFPHSGDSGIDL